jgi:unspecific monooxygenase
MDIAQRRLLIPPIPPRPDHELSFLQFLRAVRTNVLTMWTDAAYQEQVLSHRFLGRTHMLINAPDAIHHILVDNPGNYRRSPASIRILRPLTGYGLLLSQGEDWRRQRRIIGPALAPRSLPVLARHIVDCAQEAVVAFATRGNQPVDLLGAMQKLALEIAGRSMFSLEVRNYCAAMRQMLAEYGVSYARPHLWDMVLPPSVPTLRDVGRRRFQRRWMALMTEIMQARLSAQTAEAPRDLFDLLYAAQDPETGKGFSAEQLRDQIATMILAGHETTAVALFWSLFLLASAPEEQQRVAEEARGVAIAPHNAMDALPQLIRTRAVISEALRLYPPAFTLVREAIRADRAGDIDIPRHAVLMIAPWVLHRHQRLWRDPDAFDPDRFMPPPGSSAGASVTQPPRFAYLPFGAGPRVCVGAQFAMTEATLVLAMVVREFQISLVDQEPVRPVAIVTTQPNHRPLFVCRARA